jgi:hypothetical protein
VPRCLVLSLLRQALPRLFTHLRALLPLTLLRLQALQLALSGACQPPALCALFESLLRLLRAPIGVFLALQRALRPVDLSRLQGL